MATASALACAAPSSRDIASTRSLLYGLFIVAVFVNMRRHRTMDVNKNHKINLLMKKTPEVAIIYRERVLYREFLHVT
jgi:hypothetical protein